MTLFDKNSLELLLLIEWARMLYPKTMLCNWYMAFPYPPMKIGFVGQPVDCHSYIADDFVFKIREKYLGL